MPDKKDPSLIERLAGRKTYIVALFIFILETMKMMAGEPPSAEMLGMATMGATIRAGIGKRK